MTCTPRATASLIAPVTFPASEHEISTAEAPSLTACAIRCAWTWPSSAGGVSHAISTGTLCFCVNSFAAASAPVRADRKTGLVEDLAIIAILRPPLLGGAEALFAVPLPGSLLQAAASAAITASPQVHFLISVSLLFVRVG